MVSTTAYHSYMLGIRGSCAVFGNVPLGFDDRYFLDDEKVLLGILSCSLRVADASQNGSYSAVSFMRSMSCSWQDPTCGWMEGHGGNAST